MSNRESDSESQATRTPQKRELAPAEITREKVAWWRPDLVYKTFRQETDTGRFASALLTVPTCLVGPVMNHWKLWPLEPDVEEIRTDGVCAVCSSREDELSEFLFESGFVQLCDEHRAELAEVIKYD